MQAHKIDMRQNVAHKTQKAKKTAKKLKKYGIFL